MTTKKAVDKLVGDPTLSLCFQLDGKASWYHRARIAEAPMQEGRSICTEKHTGNTSDDCIINVLKLNPGTELQLLSHTGIFPYLALKVSGDKLTIPKELFVCDGMLCCTDKTFGGTTWIAEIQK